MDQVPKDQETVFLQMAVQRAVEGAKQGFRPFGALLVFGEEILAEAGNTEGPNGHAELNVITAYFKREKKRIPRRGAAHEQEEETNAPLPYTTLYASCEPCLMCTGAILRLRIGRLAFAATREEAASLGFPDIGNHMLARAARKALGLSEVQHDLTGRLEPFETFNSMS